MEDKVTCDTIPEFYQDRDLVCVEYPGIVKNIDTVIRTLGGMKNISKTHQDENKRLDLHYRPDDPCCRPVCADQFPVSSLLLKVRKYKRKKKPGEESKPDEYRYRPEISGVIETTYRFSTLCDFQFLPLHNDVKNDKLVSMLPCLELQSNKFNESIFTQEAPLFLPPATFSRIDTVQDSLFKKDVKPRSTTEPTHRQLPPDKIGVRRPRRSHNAQYIKFEDDWIPTIPLPSAIEAWKNTSRCTVEIENIIKKMFEERPIWSKNAIITQVDCHPEQLKSLLPTVAYYFLTGPWRALWVRFGYDPRKYPSAVKYQLLDFRLRQGINTPNIPVKAKRSTLHYKLPNMVPKPKQSYSKQSFSLATETKDVSDRLVPNESVYIYKPGVLPAYRQMFYQVCDIKHPEVTSLLDPYFREVAINDVCHPKSGWLGEDISQKLRDILSKDIQNTVRLSERASITPNMSKNGRRRKVLSKRQMKMLQELESQSDFEEYERSLSSDEEDSSAVEKLDKFVAKRSTAIPETSSTEEENAALNPEAILHGNITSQEFDNEELVRAASETQAEFVLEEVDDDEEENLSMEEGDDLDDMVDFLDDFESFSQELDSDEEQT